MGRKIKIGAAVGVIVVFTFTAVLSLLLIKQNAIEVTEGQEFFSSLTRGEEIITSEELRGRFENRNERLGQNHRSKDSNEESKVSERLVNINFQNLIDNIPSLVGWIQMPGTAINYPIVQGSDNQFYLDHLPNGVRNPMGSIFLDYRDEFKNLMQTQGSTLTVYGHNMRSGNKFTRLNRLRDQTFFENHSNIIISTMYVDYILRVFATYIINSQEEVPVRYFETETEFLIEIDAMLARSDIRSQIIPKFGDSIVYLVTCVDGNNLDLRRIVVGILEEV